MKNVDKFRDAFKEEARELLSGLETSLMALEEEPDNNEEISRTFRAMHTIKGSASMFGFDEISKFTHELENILDRVREGKLVLTSKLISVLLQCKDHILELLADDSPDDETLSRSKELLAAAGDASGSAVRVPGAQAAVVLPSGPAGTVVADDDEGSAVVEPAEKEGDWDPETICTYRIRFFPKKEIFANGTKPLNLIEELSSLGETTIVPYFSDLPAIDKLDAESCYLRWDILLTSSKNPAEIHEVFLFVQDTAEIRIERIDSPNDSTDAEDPRIGTILVNRGIVSKEDVEKAISKQRRLGEVLIEGGVSRDEIRSALLEQSHVKRTREKVQGDTSGNTIRVASDKLDSLVDLVGELVTLQARLLQTVDAVSGDNAQLIAISEQLERLVAELRDSTMSMRMLPLGTTFSRFKRLVRDLSQELEKDIDFLTLGGETELDKTIIDKLSEPLVHLIRNSIDHGIEKPGDRQRAGKPAQGRITLSAEHAGASVLISIEDDGKGLDVERIRAKAIERGIISAGVDLSRNDLYELITSPGFSTAEQITQVSGRGVGMDVVKRQIEELGGTLNIWSEPGMYTKFILNIPLTLAIIEGLLVDTGGERFIFPLTLIEECIELKNEGANRKSSEILTHRGELLPIIDLRQTLAIPGSVPGTQQVVIANTIHGKVGIVVDFVIGGHQTVVKSLGRLYRDAEGISGATILGDGSIALIVDAGKLAKMAAQATMAEAT